MKYFKILLFVLLFSAIDASAQYGYGNGYYRRNSGPGVMRDNRTPGTQQPPKEPTAEEIEKNRVERIDTYMANMKTDLKLDELQYIAVKNELISSSKKMDIVVKKEFSDDEKTAELKSIQEKTEKTILSYLNPTQKEKYELLKTEKPKLKDEKKKKREKEKEKDPNE